MVSIGWSMMSTFDAVHNERAWAENTTMDFLISRSSLLGVACGIVTITHKWFFFCYVRKSPH